jgi:hypothetical protein
MVYNTITERLRLALSKGPNRVGVSLPLLEVKNRSSFRNVFFSSYLEFRAMVKVSEPSYSKTNYERKQYHFMQYSIPGNGISLIIFRIVI